MPAGNAAAPIAPIATTRNPDGSYNAIRPPERTDLDLLTAAWWSQRAAPGSQSTGTVYIYGHACAAYPCVFNHLKDLAAGSLVQLRTRKGVLTYRVTDKKRLSKTPRYVGDQTSMQYSNEVAASQSGRLVLITCGYVGDTSNSPYNWVVFAQLAAAQG